MPSPPNTRDTLLDAALRLLEQRGPGALVAHLQGQPERNFASAIGTLLDALDGR